MRIFLRNALDSLGIAFTLAAGVFALYYWDPSRAAFKRLVESDVYRYDAVEPRILAEDPASYLHIGDAGEAKRLRERIIEVIWGDEGIPRSLPDTFVRDLDKNPDPPRECLERQSDQMMLRLRCEVGKYRSWKNLAGIDELRTAFGTDYSVSLGYFRPRQANGILVIYQHGFAGTYHAQGRYIESLVAAGFTVAAGNMDRYGDNVCGTSEALRWCAPSAGKFIVPFPLRIYFSPLAKTINFALREGTIRHVAMIGFSGGAWIASVMAAADPRIERSYPVAGVMPFYMRREKEWPPNQVYPPLMEVADMLDLFVLGASGAGRRQIQFFNRYDRCCYSGPRPLVYEEAVRTAVRQIGAGTFDVVIDETHARHKVSRQTFERIVEDLKLPWNR